jgi:hypothetical protein
MNLLNENIYVQHTNANASDYNKTMKVIGLSTLYGETAFIGFDDDGGFREWNLRYCKVKEIVNASSVKIEDVLAEFKKSDIPKHVKSAVSTIENHLNGKQTDSISDNS